MHTKHVLFSDTEPQHVNTPRLCMLLSVWKMKCSLHAGKYPDFRFVFPISVTLFKGHRRFFFSHWKVDLEKLNHVGRSPSLLAAAATDLSVHENRGESANWGSSVYQRDQWARQIWQPTDVSNSCHTQCQPLLCCQSPFVHMWVNNVLSFFICHRLQQPVMDSNVKHGLLSVYN